MRATVLFFSILLSLPAQATGPNDGIYTVTSGPEGVVSTGYTSIQQNGDIVIVIDLDADDFSWVVYQGIRVGDSVQLGLVASKLQAAIGLRLDFIDTINARITLVSCTPGEGVVCNAEPGAVLELVRVF